LAYQYEITNLLPIYNFFNSILINIPSFGQVNFPSNYRSITKYYKDNSKVFKSVIKILKECDLGISDIKISSLKDEDGKISYFPEFIHNANVDKNRLKFHSQSLGTRYTKLC